MSTNPSILVVDDQLVIRELFTQVLEDLGRSCETACNGKEAIEMILDRNGYDIIFCDLIMPKIDGASVLDAVHQDFPETKVVICSVQDEDSVIKSLLKKGATAYMVKPLIPKKIAEMVKDLIES